MLNCNHNNKNETNRAEEVYQFIYTKQIMYLLRAGETCTDELYPAQKRIKLYMFTLKGLILNVWNVL